MDDRLLIVGAGLAGMAAALEAINHRNWAPEQVMVVDMARSAGGRLATRRVGKATLDLGAQFFTARSDRFQAEVDAWSAAGVVEEWSRGFGTEDGFPRYRAVGGMRELARDLEQQLSGNGVEIVTKQRVSAIIPGPHHWTTVYAGASRGPDETTAVILTPPAPQTLEILAAGPVPLSAEHRDALTSIDFHAVIALLAVLDDDPPLPRPGALQQPDDETFSFVADNKAKGISQVPAVTFHTAHALSARLWTAGDDEVAEALLPAARRLVAPATIVGHQLKRWRHAGPVVPRDEPCLVVATGPGPLVVAGDGFAGAKVEGAFLSGVAAARAVG